MEGWDDPRLPTLRALRRRGYPATAIRAFCDFIGVAKTNSRHQIELLEWFIRNELNRTALRRMAVLRPVRLRITNWPEGRVDQVELANNPESPADGTRLAEFTGELYIEADDFMAEAPPKYYRLSPGAEVRLRGAYFVRCTGYETDADGRRRGVVHLRPCHPRRPGTRWPQGEGHHPLGQHLPTGTSGPPA